MRLSLRTLLAFEDHIFGQEQHQQLEQLIPKYEAASTMLNRIRSTIHNPRLGVPGLVDRREELDPNLVAEYLDHQMPEDVQERFETYCLSSDKYLAEIASIHHILSNVLGEPAQTSRECRQYCYDLYRLPATTEIFSEKRAKESELPFGSRKLSFGDYLPPTPHSETSKIANKITESNEFQVNQTQQTSRTLSFGSNRPEVVRFPQQLETENHLPSFSFVPFPHLKSVVASAAVPAQTDHSNTETDHHFSASSSFAEQNKVQPFSWVGMFWNWLTADKTEKNKTEHKIDNKIDNKTENSTEQLQPKTRKNNSLWTVLMIFLLCSTLWLGWNQMQEQWNRPQHDNNTAFINSQPEQTDSVSGLSNVSELSDVPETKTVVPFVTVTPTIPVTEVREELATRTVLAEFPEKSAETIPSHVSALPILPQQRKEQPVRSPANTNINANINTNVNTVTESSTKALPKKFPPATVTETKTDTTTEFRQQSTSTSVSPSPSTSAVFPATMAVAPKTRETSLSESELPEKPTEESLTELPEKPMLFAPNPMRHSPTATVLPDNSEAPSSLLPSEHSSSTQPLTEPAKVTTTTTTTTSVSTSTATPIKRREKPAIKNTVAARVTPTNFETPVRAKPLLVAMPEREPEPFDDQSLIAFQPISAPPKQKNMALLSPEFVEPKRQADAVSDVAPPQNPNAWTTSVVNQVPAKQLAKQSTEYSTEQPIEQPVPQPESLAISNRLTDTSPKPSLAFGNRVDRPLDNTTGNTINETISDEFASTISTQHVIPVGEVREKPEIPQPPILGRVLAVKEPCVVFSASTASDQWEMKRLPLTLHANQYLLTVSPFRAVVELESGFRVEMVGDSKFCLLEPDEHGIAGIFIDYGRLVIRPNVSENQNSPPSTQSLRLQTEKIDGTVHLTDSTSLIFVDTFAEILENNSGESISSRHVLPQTRPILGLIPDANGKISWQIGQVSLVATRQAGVLLVPDKPELGNIQGHPNWLNPLPLPPESEQLAAVCHRIFAKTNGNCEAALNLLIREPSIVVRSFGYRLWGDLGRFDIPLTFLAEAKPDEEPIRQVLVPYFREVMKRDEETVQRLADAIETVRN
ncbi:MAG: hypothetical protein LBI18_15005 [Planctomycetaceae bacterium]|jgi:hypothetical protein|nr:hypothetical protein [Planctomycetaceae bacterium]